MMADSTPLPARTWGRAGARVRGRTRFLHFAHGYPVFPSRFLFLLSGFLLRFVTLWGHNSAIWARAHCALLNYTNWLGHVGIGSERRGAGTGYIGRWKNSDIKSVCTLGQAYGKKYVCRLVSYWVNVRLRWRWHWHGKGGHRGCGK